MQKHERRPAELETLPDKDLGRRIAGLNQLAWELSDTDTRQSQALSEQALELAAALPATDLAAQAGVALSLRTLSYLNMRYGKHVEALGQVTRALDIAETLGRAGTLPVELAEGLPDLYDGLGAVYAQTGSYPEALNYIHKQLAAAEQLGDKRRVTNAYNNLAYVNMAMEQNERAIATLQKCLELAAECGHTRIECIAHLNLAELYLMARDFAEAQTHCHRGLQRSQQGGYELFEIYARKTLGRIYLTRGETEQALRALDQALADARRLGSPLAELPVLIELGRGLCAAGRRDEGLEYLQRAATMATEVDGPSELAEVHLVLSDMYEQMGDAALALAHFKQGKQISEQLLSEKNNQRLQVLQVAHDTETARKEAAQLRSLNDRLEEKVAVRTAELTDTVSLLQQEIAQRERAEAEIKTMVAVLEQRVAARTEELAAIFDLIPLAGQAGDLDDLFAQVLLRIVEITHSRALCLHLLNTERSALHLAGQYNLPPSAHATVQLLEPTGGFQRWLQEGGDPLIAIDPWQRVQAQEPQAQEPQAHGPQAHGPQAHGPQVHEVQVPRALAIEGFRTYLGAQVRIAGRSEGVLSCYRATARGYSIDEIALVTALAEQIGTLMEIRRLRRQAEEMAILAERQRLARDLHDSVTQSLYSLTLFSRAGREAAVDGDTPRLQESLSALEQNTLHALREMRLLLYELRPADLAREGLQRALELRLNTVERRAGLRLDVTIGELPPLPPACELDLYHIIVEALNNVVKHAAATAVTLRLEHREGCLRLLVGDDGGGFAPEQGAGGLGLRNMRERVMRLQGQFSIISAPGAGTTVAATLPYPIASL
jgi:signal transduction histidine kinase